MVTLSFVQGRLSSQVAGKYQHFPIHNWRKEFVTAKKLGFQSIEWIISDFSNPIFDPYQLREIKKLSILNKINITSVSLDLLMPKTLNLFSSSEIKWIFKNLIKAEKILGIRRVSIPIEETCGIRDHDTFLKVRSSLIRINDLVKDSSLLLAIESDLTPESLKTLLSEKKLQGIGVLLDIGNAGAYGYELQKYFELLRKKIYSIHIKDRLKGIGPSVKLGTGSADFEFLSKNLKRLPKLIDIVLQTYKTNSNYENDLIRSKKFISTKLRNKNLK